MSNLSVNTITDASGGSTASINGLTPQASNMQPFNRIINGAQNINQRGVSVTSAGTYVTDRWQWDNNTSTATLTFAQSTVAPTGFTNSLGITVGTADTSIAAGDLIDFRHWIEGNNVADFGLGTASAVTFTVSFWVRSSIVGTYGASFRNSDAGRVYVSTFTINVANTWEQKTITVAGDTSGTWLTDNQRGLGMNICLAGGSTYQTTAGSWTGAGNFRTTSAQANLAGTSGATFYITGVQLEAGSTASPFAHENYGDTLQKCKRYFVKFGSDGAENYIPVSTMGGCQDNYRLRCNYILSPPMRATPALSQNSLQTAVLGGGGDNAITNVVYAGQEYGRESQSVFFQTAEIAGQAEGQTGWARVANSDSGYLYFDAEL